MSIVNIFTKESPKIGGYEFDAILEDTLEASVELTGYTIEVGARAVDHRIIQPFRWTVVGAVSNNPLRVGITDFLTANSFFDDNGVLGLAAGIAAGVSSAGLAGSTFTRSGAALEFLINLMTNGEPFVISAGDITLANMVIASVRRTKDPSNENGLIFIAELQEYPTLRTLITFDQPSTDQLREGDPAMSQAAATVNKGELRGVEQ